VKEFIGFFLALLSVYFQSAFSAPAVDVSEPEPGEAFTCIINVEGRYM